MTKRAKANDKRSRVDLDAFLLGLISYGLKTPYDFMTSAGVSLGGSIPALSRLESAGYVQRDGAGARNRREYLITAKGRAFLQKSWRDLFQAPPAGDLDSILRTASLALLMAEPKRSVAGYLLRAAAQRKTRQTGKQPGVASGVDPAAVFLWMRQAALSERIRSETAVLRKIATAIRRLK